MAKNNNHFNLTLDTQAPSGTIAFSKSIQNVLAEPLTIANVSDSTGSGVAKIKLWRDTENATSASTKAASWKTWVDGGKSGTCPYPELEAASFVNWDSSATYNTAFSASDPDGNYYYHMILMDALNNESGVITTPSTVLLDRTLPVVSAFQLTDPNISTAHYYITDDEGIIYNITATDGTSPAVFSGIATVTISNATGDNALDNPIVITNPSTDTLTGTFNLSANATNGQHTLNIVAVDNAGNVSTGPESVTQVTFYYDSGVTGAVITPRHGTSVIRADNYYNFGTNDRTLDVTLRCTDSDIVSWRLWEGSDTTHAHTGTQSQGTLETTDSFTISDSDGTKVLHAEVTDIAGNSAETTFTFYIDTVLPYAAITSQETVISAISGYNTIHLTLEASDAASGIATWTLINPNGASGDSIASGTSADLPSSYSISYSQQSNPGELVEGTNTISYIITDNAGNSRTASVTVDLDTTAPTCVIADLAEWYNVSPNITATFSDDHNISALYAWTSTIAADTEAAGQARENPVSGSQFALANTPSLGQNYAHIKVIDEVGNVNYAHKLYNYDNVAPTFTLSPWATNTPSTRLTLNNVVDQTAGVTGIKIWGDINNQSTKPDSYSDYAGLSYDITLANGISDGIKTIYVQIQDAAGNESTTMSVQCELDRTTPNGSLEIHAVGDGAIISSSTSHLFSVRISLADLDDPEQTPTLRYKLYGDFAYNTTTPPANGLNYTDVNWVGYSPTAGASYVVVDNLCSTENDGYKNIYLQVIDNAGNRMPKQDGTQPQVNEPDVVRTYEVDNTAPEVTYNADLDFTNISKVHAIRLGQTEASGKYADKVTFSFKVDDTIIAYKVCAYLNAASASAGSYADPAIPQTGGSVHMSEDGIRIEPNTNISCTIRGADFETALGGSAGSADGIRIVVIYAQNDAGVWSTIAIFE